MSKKKKNDREEFGLEFGDVNAAKHFELESNREAKKDEKHSRKNDSNC
ncbi:hypothetical protein JOC86_003151 [Bacillus pakistanensis]|uniref:YfhD family protein n=1 Tax=Rossellomorea pakistanensis TaxID=992288 RepID=A0ABS2NFI1_9BACI|nr:hypothetical protein [Bacillus pakistanensis]MBM7586599.1 hypothetical protein [Bacillus pakistanensis]